MAKQEARAQEARGLGASTSRTLWRDSLQISADFQDPSASGLLSPDG